MAEDIDVVDDDVPEDVKTCTDCKGEFDAEDLTDCDDCGAHLCSDCQTTHVCDDDQIEEEDPEPDMPMGEDE